MAAQVPATGPRVSMDRFELAKNSSLNNRLPVKVNSRGRALPRLFFGSGTGQDPAADGVGIDAPRLG
jgi:hypothetical protein